jgi:hypothetical protein
MWQVMLWRGGCAINKYSRSYAIVGALYERPFFARI